MKTRPLILAAVAMLGLTACSPTPDSDGEGPTSTQATVSSTTQETSTTESSSAENQPGSAEAEPSEAIEEPHADHATIPTPVEEAPPVYTPQPEVAPPLPSSPEECLSQLGRECSSGEVQQMYINQGAPTYETVDEGEITARFWDCMNAGGTEESCLES